jgi:hypothetical protein
MTTETATGAGACSEVVGTGRSWHVVQRLPRRRSGAGVDDR